MKSGTADEPVKSTRGRRLDGGSFAVRLVALCLVPILGIVWLGSLRLAALEDASAEAELVMETTQIHRNQNAVAQSAQSERLALAGLAMADSMRVPRSLIVAVSGIDLTLMYGEARDILEAEIDEFAHRVESLSTPASIDLAERLTDIRAELDTQRRLSATLQANADDIDAVFDELIALVLESHDLEPLYQPDSGTLASAELKLDALQLVILSANQWATSIMDGLVATDLAKLVAVDSNFRIHHAHIDTFERLLDEPDRQELTELRDALETAAAPVNDVVGEISLSAEPDLAQVAAAAQPLVGVFDYLVHLGDFSGKFQDSVVEDAQSAANDAAAVSRQTRMTMYAIAALTMALLAFIAASTITPLRRLGRRAEAIGAGELALDPLPVRGPGIIRTLTSTVNDMLSTLHRVDGELTGMAAGAASTESVDIPGTIGQSIRESVDHLAQVTTQWQRSERRASAIVSQAADAIWAIDADGIIRTSNAASEQLLHVPEADQIGHPLTDFLGAIEGDTRLVTRPDVHVHVASSGDADDDANELVTVIARDVSERFRFEERLAHQARRDALTNLPNRFAVLEQLERLHEAEEAVAVLFIDIDGFKNVNDTKGHAAGDRVLAEIGQRLRETIRPTDYVARLGGDEFVVLAHNVNHVVDAHPFGRRLIDAIEVPYRDRESTFTLSASVGVAIMDRTVPALESIRRADSAVYVAKRHGRGRVEAFDAQLQASIEHDADLELALREAVRSDELVLHYQPIIDLHTNEVAGAEALVRWERPDYGLIQPNDFIGVAERSSLIVDLQRWVIRDACETLADWRRRDPAADLTIAINISGRHLVDGDLVADLDSALRATGADARLLVFELTETQLLQDVERAIEVLNEIRSRGITIAVDDFGTGYSSMTYLRDLPIDAIKIDRTFLANALADGQDEPLVDAMLTIGRSLDLKVVAEGVETEQQLAYVTARGCDYAQGFLLSMPLTLAEIESQLFEVTADMH